MELDQVEASEGRYYLLNSCGIFQQVHQWSMNRDIWLNGAHFGFDQCRIKISAKTSVFYSSMFCFVSLQPNMILFYLEMQISLVRIFLDFGFMQIISFARNKIIIIEEHFMAK